MRIPHLKSQLSRRICNQEREREMETERERENEKEFFFICEEIVTRKERD